MDGQKPNTSVQLKRSNALLLSENKEAIKKLDVLLFACANSQKLYGREPEAFQASIQVIHKVLGKYSAAKAVKAIEFWLERSVEFPTPADLVALIKRDGRRPLKESDIIAIRKKDGEDRTRADWQMLEEWEAQQQEGWGTSYEDDHKAEATLQENIRLRQRISELEAENRRAWDEVNELRKVKMLPTAPTQDERVSRTVAYLKNIGAPEDDIRAFCAQST